MKKAYNIPYILIEEYTVEDVLNVSITGDELDDMGNSPEW